MKVDSFTGSYRWLSNFTAVKVVYDKVEYPSVEHAYQAAKTFNMVEREMVCKLPTAGAAKRMGGQLMIRPDWDSAKLGVMRRLLSQKFSQEPFRQNLIDTGNMELVEGNTWGDVYWGICDGVGDNMLGKLIMEIRTQLQKEASDAEIDG